MSATFMEKPCKSATFCQERFDIFLAWFSENTFVTTLMGFMYFSVNVMLSFSSKLGHIIKYNIRQHKLFVMMTCFTAKHLEFRAY